MNIGGFEIRRRQLAATPSPPGGELGKDGDSWLSRYQGGGPDTNPVLSGSLKFDIYREMAWSDSHCRALLSMIRLPVTGAVWDFEPADGPEGERVAEACRWQFGLGDHEGQLDQSWKRTLAQKHMKHRYGCWFEEYVWGDPTSFDGRTIRPLARLAPRAPRTLSQVEFEGGKIIEVRQNLAGTVPIPGDKLAYYVLDPEPGRWDGLSLLRAAWGPFELKKQIMISSGIAWDRWAAGIPIVRYPTSGGQAELAKAEEIGRDIRNHERAYLAFAGPKPDSSYPDGWDFEIQGGVGALPDPVPLIKLYGLEILWAGLMQWMAIATSTSTGARATASVQDEPYYMAIEAHAADLADELQRQPVRRFVDVNFGEEVPAPKLTVSKIQSEDVVQLASTLAELKLAGMDFSDPDTQNDVRERLHLPDLPAGFQAAPTEGDGLPPAPAPKKPPAPGQQTLPV